MTLLKRMGVEPEERSLFGFAGLCLLFVGAGSAALQNSAETLFLKRVGVETLPLAFLISSVILAAATTWVGRKLSSVDRPRWLPRILLVLALVLVPIWALVYLGAPGVLSALLVLVKLLDGIALLAFWIALGDMITGRQAKRLFAPLAAGITIGRLIGSFGTEPASKIAGIEGLVLFAAGLYALAAAAALFLKRAGRAKEQRESEVQPNARSLATTSQPAHASGTSVRRIWRESRLFRFLVIWSFCAGALGPMLYFQFSYAVDIATKGADGEQQMLELYAQFRGWLNLAILVVQLAVSGKLYRRFGLPMSSSAWPITYLFGFFWMGIALNLPIAMAMIAAVRLEGDAVAKPALKILHNLLPERFRSQATGVTEGPAKGLGGAFGNSVVLGAIALGGPASVSVPALPLAALWMITAIALWRHYPRLLLQASSEHSLPSDSEDLKRLLDPTTVRALAASLSDPDPDVSRAAAELISEAEPATAAPTLATAIESAPPLTRPALIESLQIALEPSPPGEIHDARASAAIARVLENPEALTPEERADLVQIYARFAVTHPEHTTDAVLDAALGDHEAAVRLAAVAELSRRGSPPPGVRDLDAALAGAFKSDDVLLRRTARKEIRANLIASNPDSVWKQRLDLLARGLEQRVDREQTIRCLAEISQRHGEAIEHVRSLLLRFLSDPDPHVRAAVIAFIGKAEITDCTADLIDGLASRNDIVVREAQDSLIALGGSAINPLAERFRSDDVAFRDLVLRTLTDLRADATIFAQIYDAGFRRTCTRALNRAALTRGCALPGHALLQFLDERIEEGLNACLYVTGVESGSERISELETKLRNTRDSHQRAILIEAMESLLSPLRRAQLIPLYETDDAFERGRVAGQQLGISLPSQEQAWSDLAGDPDELIVRLHREFPPPWLAPEESIADTRGVPLQTMQITAHLQRAAGFNRLAMRELVRVADSVEEIRLATEETLVAEGEEDPSLFLLISGEVSLSQRGTEIGRLGAGELVGELSSIDGGPSAERACAATPVLALRLRREPLMALMADVPAFTIALSQLLAVRVRSLQSELAARPDAKSDEASPIAGSQNGPD